MTLLAAPSAAAPFVQTGAAADFAALFRSLDAFNAGTIGPAQFAPLCVLLRDEHGAANGGLWGRTVYGWLAIEMLFVPAALRGRRIGTAIMAAAEQQAQSRGCVGMQVETFSFQARGFYERMGFAVFGTLENLPPGHRCFYMAKTLPSV